MMKKARPNIWSRLQDFTYTHKRLSIGLVAGCLIASGAIVGVGWVFRVQPESSGPTSQPLSKKANSSAVTTPQKFYSPLTGVSVADEATAKRPVTAIMIENSIFARPQSGLKEAGVVFEAIAEGGITRLATLHQEDRPGLIGPVRSIRPYYLDWIAPFDAGIEHVGGSANALKTVRSGGWRDLDQFFNGSYFWRASDHVAPHNVYTNADKVDALNKAKGYTTSTFTGFPRKDEHPSDAPNATKIDINISSGDYNVHYDYDKASNSYLRSEGGAPHKDRELGQISPKVVVAIKVPTQLGFEDGYREQMTTIGYNDAYIFQDGTVTKGFWRKTGQKDQMTFYDANAHTIYFNPGQTWISVLAPDKAVTWQ